ncbi:MAG: CDP-alcohol phosphatidyltransferase family protein [Candidatus Omnitrophota bacterium]
MNWANRLTIFRILILPFFVAALIYYSPQKDYLRYTALAIFMIAVLTDGLDGYLARVRKERTELGTVLDPVADKALILSAFLCFSLIKGLPENLMLPAWVLILIISRDAVIILGSAVIYLLQGKLHIEPSKLGKLTTFTQMATVIWLLLALPSAKFMWMTMVVFTVASGFGYVKRGLEVLNTK